MEMTIKDFGEHLLKHNVKPSFPRIKVYEYLATRKDHPTVDEIYNAVSKEMPTLSKTTIYNTLKLFIETKLARLVTIEDNETRYDADISDHGHFKCETCGKVFDFSINLEAMNVEGLSHFRVNEKNVYYKGTCPKCLENINKN